MRSETTNRIKVGVFLPTFAGGAGAHHDCPFYERVDWKTTVDFATMLERLRFDSLWSCDHMMMGRDDEIFDGWTTLSYLAAKTRRIRLGTFVLCNSYRNPALLAKMSSTLDIASGGRLYLGLGAGWRFEEYRGYGYPFPAAPVRIEALREAVNLIKKMWSGEAVTFDGRFYSTIEGVSRPRPTQLPHPPIMIGAWGKKMLRLTAECGDMWNVADDPSPETYREKFAVIEERCKEIGRDPTSIVRTWAGHVLLGRDEDDVREKTSELKDKLSTHSTGKVFQLPSGEMTEVDPGYLIENSIHGTPGQCISKMDELVEAGVQHFILYFWDFPSKGGARLFARKVLPRLTVGRGKQRHRSGEPTHT